ncbi:hypothetical protein FACS189483_09690 [Spirochaetia bacterium]|nr:hypothetical protein FACS189483_09690 [Spirochaetia bacterium]
MNGKFVRFWVVLLCAFGFFSCATTIPVTVARPPAMNTSGINRIGVIPFGYSYGIRDGRLAERVADELTRVLSEKLSQTGRFTVVTSTELTRLERQLETLADHIDALFTGTVNNITSHDDSSTSTYEDRDGNIRERTTYSRTVTVDFTYQLLNARDRSIIGQVTKGSGSGFFTANSLTDYDGDWNRLASPYDLAVRILQSQLRNFNQDVVPYTAIEHRTLADPTTRDKTIKNQMKDALALVKNGSYQPALTRYQAIYRASGEFAAGYNAAIMAEVLGDMNNAIALMSGLYDDTGNPRARTELERMRSTLSDAIIVEQRYRDNDGHVAAVIRQVASELTTRVPDTAVLSILNTSSSEKQLTDFVVDGLTSNLINNSRFAIIDRQNSRLIDAEKQFQMSGSVSDESAVSIGHELGVNTMVLCSIAGRSSLRRLTVRVIDVETARIVFQTSLDI